MNECRVHSGCYWKIKGFLVHQANPYKIQKYMYLFGNHSRRVCSTMNANQMGHILNVFIALCTFHIIFIHTAHIYIDVLRHFGTLLFFPVRYEINHELILSVFSFISKKNHFTWNGNEEVEEKKSVLAILIAILGEWCYNWISDYDIFRSLPLSLSVFKRVLIKILKMWHNTL